MGCIGGRAFTETRDAGKASDVLWAAACACLLNLFAESRVVSFQVLRKPRCDRVLRRQGAEVLDPVERDQVRIVLVMGAAFAIVESCAIAGRKVVPVEHEIGILKPVVIGVGAV